MDEKNKTNREDSGKTYSIEEIMLEYGRAPVRAAQKEEPGSAPSPKPEREPVSTAEEPVAEEPAIDLAAEVPDGGGDDILTAEAGFGEWDQPVTSEREEAEPEAVPAISVTDFDQAYKQQRREMKKHRNIVLKTRGRNKRYRYIKEVKKIAGELGEEIKQREQEEIDRIQNRSIGEHIADYTALARSLAVRQWICLFFALAVAYLGISSQAGLPVPAALIYRNHPYLFLCVNIVLMSGIMLCGLEIFTSGVRSLLRFRPDMDSLVALSTFLCFIYCISVVILPKWGGYLSFSGVAALNMYLAILGRRRVASAKSKALRTAAKVKTPMTIVRRSKEYKDADCLAKVPVKDIGGFVKGLEERGLSTKIERVYSAVSVAALIVLSFVCLFRGDGSKIPFYVSSVAAMLPSCGLVAGYALPYGRVSKRLMREGVAIGGGEGIRRLGADGRVILTDGDLFNSQSITLQGYKLFGDIKREEAITYTASVLAAAGCGVARQFNELAIKEFCQLLEPSEMEYSDYGGIKAVIDGSHIMVGTAPYMYRMGLRPPSDIKLRTAVFCAVNRELVAVFALRYLPNDTHRHWINLLMSTKRAPVLASRDFNVTPALIEQRFRIKPGQLEYPEIEQRLELNSTLETSDGSFGVLVLRDTLESYIGSVEGCRRLAKISGANAFMGLISSLFGAGVVAGLMLNGSYVAVSPLNVLLYSLLWTVATFLLSGWVSRF